MSLNEFLDSFKSYKWNELYEKVKTVEYDPGVPIQNQQALAIKAMLLVAWWSDDIASKNILRLYPPIITDPATHFFITCAYICLADLEKIRHYRAKSPKHAPGWMNSYIEIEVLGRSLKEKKQADLIGKLTGRIKNRSAAPLAFRGGKNRILDDYIKVALLQSLENPRVNIEYLRNYLKKINLVEDESPLSELLCLRCELLSIDDIDKGSLQSHPLLMGIKAVSLTRQNKLLEGITCYDMVAEAKYLDLNTINRWLELCLSLPQGKVYFMRRASYAMELAPGSLMVQGTIASYMLVFSWLNGDYKQAYDIAVKYHRYRELPKTNFTRLPRIFFGYILYLCSHWQNNRHLYVKDLAYGKELYVFGESHCLSLSNINLQLNYNNFNAISNYMAGIKMYHCSVNGVTYYSACLLEHLKFIKSNADIMFTIGEIDTRPNEGIWRASQEKEMNLDEVIENTVSDYIEFLYGNLKSKQLGSIIIQGIPAPNYALEGENDPKDKEKFLGMIKKVNETLKKATLRKGWRFLDVYSATVDEFGKSNKKWHIDAYHLQPIFYMQADNWLI